MESGFIAELLPSHCFRRDTHDNTQPKAPILGKEVQASKAQIPQQPVDSRALGEMPHQDRVRRIKKICHCHGIEGRLAAPARRPAAEQPFTTFLPLANGRGAPHI
jgi:hypothetical protein